MNMDRERSILFSPKKTKIQTEHEYRRGRAPKWWITDLEKITMLRPCATLFLTSHKVFFGCNRTNISKPVHLRQGLHKYGHRYQSYKQ